MTMSDNKISRRNFLNKMAKTGLVFYTLGPVSGISPASSLKTSQAKSSTNVSETSGPHRYIDQSSCIGCGYCEPL